MLAERLDKGQVRERDSPLVAATDDDLGPPELRVDRELLRKSGLSDPGLPDDHEDPAPSREGTRERRLELLQLGSTSHEATPRGLANLRTLVHALLGGRLLRVADPLKLLRDRACARRSLVGVLLEEPQDQRVEPPRDLGVVPRRSDGGRVEVLGDDRDGVVTQEGRASRHHLIERGAQCVEVAPRVGAPPEGLLRRHVRRGADHHPLLRQAGAVEGDGQTEIAELRGAVQIEVDVRGLEIAVDHAAGVRVLERPAELLGDAERLVAREAVAFGLAQPPLEIARGHVLADDVDLTPLLGDVEDRHDVRVVAELAHGLCLAAHP